MQKNNFSMPSSENGFVPTLNKQGYMATTLDYYMKQFISYAKSCKKPVVDIGAAYGIATIPSLETGANVIAVDLDERHLAILEERVPHELKNQLTIKCCSFPEELHFNRNSIGAFLIARVVHFFSPVRLEKSVSLLYDWLAPEGKVFLTAETPYLSNWESFIPIYEQRCVIGHPWLGYVDDVMKFAPKRGENLPSSMLFLDP